MKEPPIMTPEEALGLLRGGRAGVEEWNERRRGGGRMPRLPEIDLSNTNLQGANISRLDLTGAKFFDADLSGADIENSYAKGANLRNANLEGVRLNRAKLHGAVLTGAKLQGSDLTGCGAPYANFRDADLRGVDFTHANLRRSDLTGANLENAVFQGTELGETVLANVDLSALCRSLTIVHLAPSVIDERSIVRAMGEPRLTELLRQSGMSEAFIEASLAGAGDLCVTAEGPSAMISYGGPDEGFARNLNEALVTQGIRTFFFPNDAVPGQRLSTAMHEAVRGHKQVILVCSKASLQRPGVLNEIQETLDLEAEHGGASYLIPIRLDDYVLGDWAPSNPHLARSVRARVVADFSVGASFRDGVGRLASALRRQWKSGQR